MQKLCLFLALTLALLCALTVPAATQSTPWQASAGYSDGGFGPVLNAYRKQNGRNALRPSNALAATARAHAIYMLSERRLNHQGFDGSRLYHRLKTRGIQACRGGENLARGQTSNRRVLTDWINSPTHKDILLMDGVTHYGLARVRNYWVMVVAAFC